MPLHEAISASQRKPDCTSARSDSRPSWIARGRTHRAIGVVVVRSRGPEERRDSVAEELVDRAIVAVHGTEDDLEGPARSLASAHRVVFSDRSIAHRGCMLTEWSFGFGLASTQAQSLVSSAKVCATITPPSARRPALPRGF